MGNEFGSVEELGIKCWTSLGYKIKQTDESTNSYGYIQLLNLCCILAD